MLYKEHQEAFPGPMYQPTHSLAKNVRIQQLKNKFNVPMATTTRQILSEVEPLYQEAYGQITNKTSQVRCTD